MWRSCQATRIASTSEKYLYSVARPIPVSSAIRDIVTERSPSLATRAAAVSRVASCTAWRCASIVLFQSFGIASIYATTTSRHYGFERDKVYRKIPSEMNLPSDPDNASTTSLPRWVKVFAIIAISLALLVVILHLTGNTLHDHSPLSSVIEHGAHQP
jgi:hypothetical protein